MDILIKSFNRPYYLDKCIGSILKFVQDNEMRIIVLDDGTPEKYLEKIQTNYPKITILKSEYYNDKRNLIITNSQAFIPKIPIDLWAATAEKSSEYFMLLEDDVWFNKPLNINDLEPNLRKENLLLLKLYWLGNSKLIPKNILKTINKTKIFKAKLITQNKFLYKLIFHVQRLNINKIMVALKINTEQRKLDYYHIYATAGAIFNKKYFLELWKNHTNEVDEILQIKNALSFINKNTTSKFAHLENEIVKTGFASAATNTHKKYKNVTIDMFAINKILNEYWFKDAFLTNDNYDKDLDFNQIENILEKENNKNALKTEWQKWTTAFKKQYTDFGCQID